MSKKVIILLVLLLTLVVAAVPASAQDECEVSVFEYGRRVQTFVVDELGQLGVFLRDPAQDRTIFIAGWLDSFREVGTPVGQPIYADKKIYFVTQQMRDFALNVMDRSGGSVHFGNLYSRGVRVYAPLAAFPIQSQSRSDMVMIIGFREEYTYYSSDQSLRAWTRDWEAKTVIARGSNVMVFDQSGKLVYGQADPTIAVEGGVVTAQTPCGDVSQNLYYGPPRFWDGGLAVQTSAHEITVYEFR